MPFTKIPMPAMPACRGSFYGAMILHRPGATGYDPTMDDTGFVLTQIGTVESPLTDPESAPKQGFEGSPVAWLVFDPAVSEGLQDLREGEQIIVLTWLHRAARDILKVHPRDDPSVPEHGVFSTRSSDRPNPIGLHLVEIVSIEDLRIQVRNLEAVDGTPILDVKPRLHGIPDA